MIKRRTSFRTFFFY